MLKVNATNHFSVGQHDYFTTLGLSVGVEL